MQNFRRARLVINENLRRDSDRELSDDEKSDNVTNVTGDDGHKIDLMNDERIYELNVVRRAAVVEKYSNHNFDEWAHLVEETVEIHKFIEYGIKIVIDKREFCIYFIEDCQLYTGNAQRHGGGGAGGNNGRVIIEAGTCIVEAGGVPFDMNTDWDSFLSGMAKGLPKYLTKRGAALPGNQAINARGRQVFYDLLSGTMTSIYSRRISRRVMKKRAEYQGPQAPEGGQMYFPPPPFFIPPPPQIPPAPINPPEPVLEREPHWKKEDIATPNPVLEHLVFDTPMQNRQLPSGNIPVHMLDSEQLVDFFSEIVPVIEFIPQGTYLTINKAYKHVLGKWSIDKDDLLAQRKIVIFWRVVVSPIMMDDGKRMQSRVSISKICKWIMSDEWDKITVGLYVMRQRRGLQPQMSEEKIREAVGKRASKEILRGNISKAYGVLVNEGTLQSNTETRNFLNNLIPTGKSVNPSENILIERRELEEARNRQMDDEEDPVVMDAFENLMADDTIVPVTITEVQLLKAVSGLKNSTACFDGGKMEYFKYVVFSSNNLDDDRKMILTLLTSFLNFVGERKVHTDILKFLNTARLFAIRSGKPEQKKMRPIYQQNCLMKLLMKAVHGEYAVVARSIYNGLQTEGMMAGTEKVIHLLELYIEKNPHADVVQLDLINAFSLVNRETLAYLLEKLNPQLAKTLVGVALAPPTHAVWGDSDDGPQQFSTDFGTSIGSIFGTTLFSQTLQPHLEAVEKILKLEAEREALRSNSDILKPLVVAFVDDITMAGHVSGLTEAIKHFKTAETREKTGLFTNVKKEKVLLGLKDGYDEALAAVELYHEVGVPYENIYIHPGNIPDDCPNLKVATEKRYTLMCLGTPIGSTAAKVIFFEEKIKKLAEEAKKLSLYQNSQFQTHLFLHCFCQKTQYLLRTMPLGGTLKTFLHLEDDLKRIVLAAGILKIHPDKLSENSWSQAKIHRGDGGMGIGSNLTIASAAYLASIIESLPFMEPHFPGITERMKTMSAQIDTGNFSLRENHFLDAIKTLNKNSGENDYYTSMKLFDPEFIKQEEERMTKDPHLSNARRPTLQLILCNGIRKHALATLLKKVKHTDAHRMAAAANVDSGITRVLTALPSMGDFRLRINDQSFIIGILNLLGHPLCGQDSPLGLANKSCSTCKQMLGAYPYQHFFTKNCLAMKTGFHDSMKEMLLGLLRSLGLNGEFEKSLFGRKDCDILMTSMVESLKPFSTTGIDLTFPHCTAVSLNGKDPTTIYYKHSQDIVNIAHTSKLKPETVNRLSLAHVNFRTFVMGTNGEIHKLSTALLRSIAEEVAKNGFWKSRSNDLLRFMLTIISVHHFRAKSECLIKTMRTNNRNSDLNIMGMAKEKLLEVFEAYDSQVESTKMNEPYQILILPIHRSVAG